ncbi:MAG: ATP-dependent Clp protease ATP-binding subunit [Oscillospiraceae bacterium]|jgi:ATP-dependent Clp protease ATP-binding subunit ClpA|nr:ATP-dependent Clp protease ATP-binding subunit [Oscillospiraceae bacterium]
MDNSNLCSKCHQRPAVVFVAQQTGDKRSMVGLCFRCAMETGLAPLSHMVEQDGNLPDMEKLRDKVMELFGGLEGELQESEGFMMGGTPTIFPSFDALLNGNMTEERGGREQERQRRGEKSSQREKKPEKKKRKFLDTYCVNLTAEARQGKLDAVVGREKELYRVVQILSRRSKNNPCLIGEPGVGKTAIAEGLAIRITGEEVPARLADKELHLLDLTALVAGTQFRGQFEARVKGLIDEVKADGNIILFIDEIHTLVGTGDAEGSMNAANILKPALSRGSIQVIGATTFKEYRKYIEKDAALERRFQPVTVDEPSQEETVAVLEGIRQYYEDFHGVTVPDGVLRRAVLLSQRYIFDRFLPDKAIDLLDEACAAACLRNRAANELEMALRKIRLLHAEEEALEAEEGEPDYEKLANIKSDLAKSQTAVKSLAVPAAQTTVTDDDLARVIELWTGIPAAKVKESDLKKLLNLEEKIRLRVVGQDEAIAEVSAAVRRSRVQISTRRRPASFIFVGPTGVGKTELVKVLSEELFSSPETLIRLDMSEYMEKHSVSRIIGAPPGYVGYEEAGQLTEKVRRKPYSVLLFDEIEKAHPDVLNVLLQILDDGRVTDAQGRTVNFENTIIVMTSNAGSERRESALGFGKTQTDASREKAIKALKEFLRPEFISRVDEVVVFTPLGDESFSQIAALMLAELVAPLAEKGIRFSWEESVPGELAKRAYGGTRGARDLRNLVRREAEDGIANLLVRRCDSLPEEICMTLAGGAFGLRTDS